MGKAGAKLLCPGLLIIYELFSMIGNRSVSRQRISA
jgi:hypothetical protein